MLLKSKKRIAALFTAAVMILTTAFSMSGIVRAEEETASDTDAAESGSPDPEEDGIATQDLQEAGIEVYDLDGQIRVYRRDPNTNKSDLFLTFSGSYQGSTPFITYDESGRMTESYCMQHDKPAPPVGMANAVAYQSGVNYATGPQVGGDCAIAMYGFGGSNADPNAGYFGGTHNTQDGGTYGTYLVSNGAGGVKAVRGLMICGSVYEMTIDEARSLMQTAIHQTAAGYSTIGTVYGKTNRNSVHDAYERLVQLSNAVAQRCSMYNNDYGDARIVNVLNGTNRSDSIHGSGQQFTITVYNNETGSWDAYTDTASLPTQYRGADGTAKFKIDYTSHGMCNKLVSSASAGAVTVTHNYPAYTVNTSVGYHDYFVVNEAAGNTVPFTVSFDMVTAGTYAAFDDFWYNTTENIVSFNQTAYLTCSYADLQHGKLAFSASTGTGTKHTPFYGDGDGDSGSRYAARLYRNATYQDTLFCSPAAQTSTSIAASASAIEYGSISLYKKSANLACTNGNACYSLEGAVYNVYAGASASGTPAATLITNATGYASVSNLVAGPYTVKEVTAPKGYSLDPTEYHVTVSEAVPVVVNSSDQPKMDPVSILLTKKNRMSQPVAGAQYTIKYYKGVKMDTDPAAAGVPLDRSWIFKTDENGAITFSNNSKWFVSGDEFYITSGGFYALPEGTVTIQETYAPEGYVCDPTVYVRQITPGADADIGVSTFNEVEVSEDTIRGDLSFTKVNEAGEKLANVKFSLTNTDTGESHIIWTDEDGYYSTSSDYIKHSKDTNSDKAGSGIWFGDEDLDDTVGALPYGTYELKELRCDANKDKYKTIDPVRFSVTENQKVYEIGSIINENFPTISTTVMDTETKTNIAAHSAVFNGIDAVKLKKLEAGHTYTLVMKAYSKAKGSYLVEAKKEFEADAEEMIVDIDVKFDVTDDLAGSDVVIFEALYDAAYPDELIAFEEDLGSAEQTIHFPEIGTTFTDAETGDHVAYPGEKVKHTDVVAYTNLLVGKTYKTVAELYFTDNGETVKDADGNAITQEVEFTPEKPDGTIDVTFEFDASLLAGRSIVAFEKIYYEEKEVAAHEDLTDEGQTIRYPKIGTTFTDSKTGTHKAETGKKVKHIDAVAYTNLLPGKTYKTVATLKFKDSGEPVKDADGKEITQEVEFTPETPDGTVDVVFEFDASLLAGRSIVAFEKVYYEEKEVAAHEDLTDEGQTITYPPAPPKTGDPVKPIIPIVLGVVAAAGIVGMIIYRKKHK